MRAKRILLVADEPGWIFERHCQELKKRLTEFDIEIAFRRANIPKKAENFDLVYVLDPMPMTYPPADKTIIGLRCQFLYEDHPNGAKGLYKYGFPGRCVSIRDKCSIFHVVNKSQMEAFKDIVVDQPLVLAQHGVDTDLFNPSNYFPADKSFGTSIKVSTSGRGSRNKGFGIVKEVCDSMDGVTNVSAQFGNQKRTKEQMPEFYAGVDVHVCMSKSEGLNNPLLEAGAMGVPIVATKTGAAAELIKDGHNGFLIDRNANALKEALAQLQVGHNRRMLGDSIRKTVLKDWSWDVRIEDYRNMFNMYFDEVQK
jgi:glycosyltransferase involved in cell wall biosynthesis